ncbi:Fungalysin/Thermolysin Extracellular metalloproteinase 5 [Tulasnella sp. 417]|nr:Fungalysin/Thermolysin Extracellular metalloproteinase 5 [Tulasnella sp. 417]
MEVLRRSPQIERLCLVDMDLQMPTFGTPIAAVDLAYLRLFRTWGIDGRAVDHIIRRINAPNFAQFQLAFDGEGMEDYDTSLLLDSALASFEPILQNLIHKMPNPSLHIGPNSIFWGQYSWLPLSPESKLNPYFLLDIKEVPFPAVIRWVDRVVDPTLPDRSPSQKPLVGALYITDNASLEDAEITSLLKHLKSITQISAQASADVSQLLRLLGEAGPEPGFPHLQQLNLRAYGWEARKLLDTIRARSSRSFQPAPDLTIVIEAETYPRFMDPGKRVVFDPDTLREIRALKGADPVQQDKSISLSFGPPVTCSIFNTAPPNPRGHSFDAKVDDQASTLALANRYIEQVLKYPKGSWLLTENDVRQDLPTGVWRADARQVVHNGTVEIVNGKISLNMLNGEVISYGDSFYRGPPPDLTVEPSDDHENELLPTPKYSLPTYCETISQLAHQRWMRENPKWRDWFNQVSAKYRSRSGDRISELRSKCEQNIQRVYIKCIQEHLAPSTPTSLLDKAKLWWQREVNHDYSDTADAYRECAPLERLVPLDRSNPSPFKAATTYDEETCTWNFVPNLSTVSAHLHTLYQAHCDAYPRLVAPNGDYCRSPYFDFDFMLDHLIRYDRTELMEKEGIMDPAIAVVSLVGSLRHGKNEAFGEVRANPEKAHREIESLRQPTEGRYAFELKNVPGADGAVNATLVYVQTPPKPSPEMFVLDEEDDEHEEAYPISSLIRAWKVSILFKNGRKFEGYVKAGPYPAPVRLLDLSSLAKQPQGLLSSAAAGALDSLSEGTERGESCFGWGESAAIREGFKQFLGGLASDGGKIEPIEKQGGMTKPSAYGSLNRLRYWGVEGMGRVWAEILGSVNQTVGAHSKENSRDEEVPADSHPRDNTHRVQSPSKNDILASLIPASLALLPCNPTFLMARDALIQADQIVLGGSCKCDLWRGFAERGMGISAHGPTEMMWTPWGGVMRIDGFDIPKECTPVGKEGMEGDAMKNRKDEL